MSQGHVERATLLAQEALQLAERGGDPAGISAALGNLGRLAQARGDREQAASYFEESYVRARQPGGSSELGRALFNLAGITRLQGDLARSRALFEEALSYARAQGFSWGIANTLTMLGHLAREQRDYPLARARYQESLELYRTIGNPTYIAWCLEGIAALLCAQHRYEPAIQLSAAAATLRLKEQTPLPPAEREAVEHIITTAKAALKEPDFQKEWATGSAFTQDEAIDYALSSIAS